jgi:hypothetical protein
MCPIVTSAGLRRTVSRVMSAEGDRRLGMIFGVIAALLLVVAALVRFLVGVAFLATGRGFAALGSEAEAVVFLVVGLVIGFFAISGRSRGTDRSLAVGVILVVLALAGWLALSFGSSLLAILAAVFTLIAGILFLVAGR